MRGRITAIPSRWLGLTGAGALSVALLFGTASFPTDALGQPAPPGVTVPRVTEPTVAVQSAGAAAVQSAGATTAQPAAVSAAPRAEPRVVVAQQQPTSLPRTGTGPASDPVPAAATWALTGIGILALGGAAIRGLRRASRTS